MQLIMQEKCLSATYFGFMLYNDDSQHGVLLQPYFKCFTSVSFHYRF